MTADTRLVNIIDGPSREELFDGLRLFEEHRMLEFELESHLRSRKVAKGPRGGRLVAGRVLSIGAEEPTGHSWNVNLRFAFSDMAFEAEGHYNTRHRKGFLYMPTR